MINDIFFKGPDMFAEFGRVSVFCVLEQCSVVSVPSLEVIFCKSDVSQWWCCPHMQQWLGRLVMTGGSFC